MRKLEDTPGVQGVYVTPSGTRLPVVDCADCGKTFPARARGLCHTCYERNARHGTLGNYGYLKQDRMHDYNVLRCCGNLSVKEAAYRAGISERTAERYEIQLRAQ